MNLFTVVFVVSFLFSLATNLYQGYQYAGEVKLQQETLENVYKYQDRLNDCSIAKHRQEGQLTWLTTVCGHDSDMYAWAKGYQASVDRIRADLVSAGVCEPKHPYGSKAAGGVK